MTSKVHVLNHTGDDFKEWDTQVVDERVDIAEEFFATALKSGGAAAAEYGDGEMVQITEFDPDAQRIVIIPQYRGG